MARNPLEGARKTRKGASPESLARQNEIAELRASIASSEQELTDYLTTPPEKRTDAEVIRADMWQAQAKLDHLLKEEKKERKLAKHDDRQERLTGGGAEVLEEEREETEVAPEIKHSDAEAISSTVPVEEVNSKAEQKAKLESLISEYERRMNTAMEPEVTTSDKKREETGKPEASTMSETASAMSEIDDGLLGVGRNKYIENVSSGKRVKEVKERLKKQAEKKGPLDLERAFDDEKPLSTEERARLADEKYFEAFRKYHSRKNEYFGVRKGGERLMKSEEEMLRARRAQLEEREASITDPAERARLRREEARQLIQLKTEARKEAMKDEGRWDQKVFDKVGGAYVKWSQNLEKNLGPFKARAVRSAAFTFVAGAAGATALALSPAASFTAFSLLAGAGTVRFARSVAAGTFGVWAGGKLSDLYKNTIGEKQRVKSEKRLEKLDVHGQLSDATFADFMKRFEKNYTRAQESTLQKKMSWVKAGAMVGVGGALAATSMEIHNLMGHGGIAEHAPNASHEHPQAHHAEKTHEHHAARHEGHKHAVHHKEQHPQHVRTTHHAEAGTPAAASGLTENQRDIMAHEVAENKEWMAAQGSLEAEHAQLVQEHAVLPNASDPNYLDSVNTYIKNLNNYQMHLYEFNEKYPSGHPIPEHAPVTSVQESVQSHAETAQVEAAPVEPAPVEHLEHVTAIDSIKGMDGWSAFGGRNAGDIFNTPAAMGDADLKEFRKSMFEILRQSGTGPHENESVADYVSRAQQAIQGHASRADAFNDQVAIRNSGGRLIVHGGDLNARLALANEYNRVRPEMKVYVENPEGRTKLFAMPANHLQNDVNEYPPADFPPPKVSPNDPVIF